MKPTGLSFKVFIERFTNTGKRLQLTDNQEELIGGIYTVTDLKFYKDRIVAVYITIDGNKIMLIPRNCTMHIYPYTTLKDIKNSRIYEGMIAIHQKDGKKVPSVIIKIESSYFCRYYKDNYSPALLTSQLIQDEQIRVIGFFKKLIYDKELETKGYAQLQKERISKRIVPMGEELDYTYGGQKLLKKNKRKREEEWDIIASLDNLDDWEKIKKNVKEKDGKMVLIEDKEALKKKRKKIRFPRA